MKFNGPYTLHDPYKGCNDEQAPWSISDDDGVTIGWFEDKSYAHLFWTMLNACGESEWLIDKDFVYQLTENTGAGRHTTPLVNRWSFQVQSSGKDGASLDERCSVAALASMAPELFSQLSGVLTFLSDQVEDWEQGKEYDTASLRKMFKEMREMLK